MQLIKFKLLFYINVGFLLVMDKGMSYRVHKTSQHIFRYTGYLIMLLINNETNQKSIYPIYFSIFEYLLILFKYWYFAALEQTPLLKIYDKMKNRIKLDILNFD